MPHFERHKFYVFGHQGGNRRLLGVFRFISNRDSQALDQNVTKHSPSLNRDASYSQHSRLERLPAYLTVHMVRFAWKADISKKVKIMVRTIYPVHAYTINHLYPSSAGSNSLRNTMRWILSQTS